MMELLDSDYLENNYLKHGNVEDATNHYHVGDISLIPVLNEQSKDITNQQILITKLIADFNRDINRGKSCSKDIWVGKLLQDLNLNLFGCLGRDQTSSVQVDPFPRATQLTDTKHCFSFDLIKMLSVVKNWTLRGDRIVINCEISFRIGGVSEVFYNTLFWLLQFPINEPRGQYHLLECAKRIFGAHPGESGFRSCPSIWQPEHTAVLIRKSLTDENTVGSVIAIINNFKEKQHIRMNRIVVKNIDNYSGLTSKRQMFRELGSLESPAMNEIDRIYFINKRKSTIDKVRHEVRNERCELKVQEICRAREFVESIPEEAFKDLENLMGSIRSPLAFDVPFVLTPELYILSGPVKIDFEIITDPLMIMRFKEFPYLMIPIANWLPVIRGHEISNGIINRGNSHSGITVKSNDIH